MPDRQKEAYMLTLIAIIIAVVITLIALVFDIFLGPIGLLLAIPIIIGWCMGVSHAKKAKEEEE